MQNTRCCAGGHILRSKRAAVVRELLWREEEKIHSVSDAIEFVDVYRIRKSQCKLQGG